MCRELIEMINSKAINANQYFTMNPYTQTEKEAFNMERDEVSFLEDINLLSNKTFERLVRLAEISQNVVLNTLIITGYRGAGKSNFLHLCNALVNGKTKIMDYREVCREHIRLCPAEALASQPGSVEKEPDFFDERFEGGAIDDRNRILISFNKSLKEIKKILGNEFQYKDEGEIQNEISEYLNQTIRGESVFIDFDEGKRESSAPLAIKADKAY